MKKLSTILNTSLDINIIGITDDSRNVKKDFLFVATKGFNVDHFDYINDAIKAGAVCVVSDRYIDIDVPLIIIENINDIYVDLCEKFYDVSPNEFKIIGITGTDGKTTTCNIIWQLLNNFLRCACIGTNGVYVDDLCLPVNNTTPCISEMYRILSDLKNRKCFNIVMEVSSEALLHNRLKNFLFDCAIFTNITEDHLNIHKTIDNYIECKFKLLDKVKNNGIVIFNGDDVNCQKINVNNMYSVGFSLTNDFVIKNVNKVKKGMEFMLKCKDNSFNMFSNFIGLYNLYNISFSFTCCYLMGYSEKILLNKLKSLIPVAGRGELLNFGQDFDIILDYAHTYNSIFNILNAVSNYKNIIVVTGAAGGREKEKREKIGHLILDRANTVIFTMDDPRFESVDDIIDQMVTNSPKKYLRILDRRDAIYKAFDLANSDSVVLVLGKGRDSYMAIEDRREIYSDYNVIKSYFEK